MIEMRDVSVVYPNGTLALHDVNLFIDKGEFAFIVGPTGMGKSTLFKLIYREELPTTGVVLVEGQDVTKIPKSRVPFLRRRVGVVFQDFRLLESKSVSENVGFALDVIGASKRDKHRKVARALDLVGLSAKADNFPHELSGGEQQRVSIARALVNNPPILLADEPTGNLDPESSWHIIQLLAKINIKGTTVLVATHDREIVDRMNKRVITVEHGTIVSDRQRGPYNHEP